MSYDIELCDPDSGEVLPLGGPPLRGGTYAFGEVGVAELNVTYNYAPHFYRVMGEKGIRTIYGKSGAESIPILDAAIAQLGDDVDRNYWEPTEGNAKRALIQLRTLAQRRPDGVWKGD